MSIGIRGNVGYAGDGERATVRGGGMAAMAEEPFKDYLRRQIAASGIGTQLALARLTGIDVSYVNRIATGRILRPEIETLEKLATALGRPIAEVMRAAGYPTPRPDPPASPRLVLLSPAGPEEFD